MHGSGCRTVDELVYGHSRWGMRVGAYKSDERGQESNVFGYVEQLGDERKA